MTASSQPRQTLRQQLRAKRRQLSAEQQQLAAAQLANQCRQQPCFSQARTLAFYLANDGEIDPMPLLAQAHKAGQQCFLPVLQEQQLLFRRYAPGDPLQANRFGIAEPLATADTVAANALDIICLPLVAFDRCGNRLGMGGGYYDRTLAQCQTLPPHPQLIGLAHALQECEQLIAEAWDIPLQVIATEKEWIACANTAGESLSSD